MGGPGKLRPGRRHERDDPQLAAVRKRIKHVVVLMLENRSFDHLFGYLGLPDVPPPPEACANPHDLGKIDPSPVPPSPNGKHVLALDPPHSHHGAKLQMGAFENGRYAMNGFVNAYRLKLLGKEHLPVIHWKRLAGVAIVLSPLLAAAVASLASRVETTDWRSFLAWTVPPLVALRAVANPLVRAADVRTWKVNLGVAGAALVTGNGAAGIVRFARTPSWGAALPCGVSAALAVLGVAWARRREGAKRKRLAASMGPKEAAERAEAIMRCMPPAGVTVLGRLATEFVTCARWYASVPGATWPNRNFVHAGTSEESVDIEIGFYGRKTIFEVLDEQKQADGDRSRLTTPPWRIYRDGMPQVMVFDRLWEEDLRRRWRTLDRFEADCAKGRLATYSFIEPRHSDGLTNSLHPGNNEKNTGSSSDFARGEELVHTIYSALKRHGLLERTALIVTFDEHGGFFDRESPPTTKHPDVGGAVRHPLISARRIVGWFIQHKNEPFDFRRLGVRVPTVVVSGRVPQKVDFEEYDHSSVIATLCDLFAPGQQRRLGRARRAKSFWHLFSLADARPLPDIPPPSYRAGEGVEAADPGLEDVPHPPPPERAAHQSDDLVHQLMTLAPKAERVLDRRQAPEVAGMEALSPTERVDARLTVWAAQDDE